MMKEPTRSLPGMQAGFRPQFQSGTTELPFNARPGLTQQQPEYQGHSRSTYQPVETLHAAGRIIQLDQIQHRG
jgi:hypothetical protein